MAYGLPEHGDPNWDTKLNNSIAAVKETADAALPAGQKGAASGVAPLDGDSRVPQANLPAHLDPDALSASFVGIDEPGFDLIICAGQSNMSGWAADWNTAQDPLDSRIWQFATSGTYADKISQAAIPLGMVDTPAGLSPAMEFARWYATSVPANRRVLLVPVAKGGVPFEGTSSPSGFTWKVGRVDVTNLYDAAVAQTEQALAAAGSGARVVAALWVQGETDGDQSNSAATYQTNLDALIAALRTDLGLPDLPFVIGQMVPEYLGYPGGTTPGGTRQAINAVHADTPNRVERTAFAAGPFGGNRTDDSSHYNASGARGLGRSLFEAFRRILSATADPAFPATLGPVADLAAGTPTDTTVPLTWTALSGAGAYVIERSVSPFTAWVRCATSTGPSVTVTGLTPNTTYRFRVFAVNAAGKGAFPTTPTHAEAVTPTSAPKTDNFDRADSASGLGTASDGGTWSYAELSTGLYGISGNRAYMATPVNGAKALRTVGTANTKVSVLVPTLTWTGSASGTENAGVLLYADDLNYLTATWQADGSLRLYKRVSSTYTQVGATLAAGTVAVGDSVELEKIGTAVKVYVNGVEVLSATVSDASIASVPYAGLRNAGTLVKYWDDFSAEEAV